MGDDHQGKTFSRRNVLKVLAGAAGVATHGPVGSFGAAEAPHCASSAATLQGAATEALPRFLNADRIRTLTVLVEAIIPADDHSPGAAAAGVPTYIDEVLLKSPEERKALWIQGLEAIDRMAKREFSARFAECTTSQQDQLLLKISAHGEKPSTVEEKFFETAKHLTVEGYYNSEIGLQKDLEYQGNTALAEFEGCTHPEHGAPTPEIS
jgi:hypothetical protein